MLLILAACGAGAQAASVRLAVVGDYGTGSRAAGDVARLVESWSPDFVVTTGDNNYPDGAAETIDRNIGQFYHAFIFPYRGAYGPGAMWNRFFPVLGNHDWDSPGAAPYLEYFTLPGNERYYDVVLGPIHVFMLDSDPREPDGHEGDAQAAWLQAGLAASTAAWKVVVMHHPPYSSGPHGSSSWMQWRFEAWGAHAVLAGHDHLYERVTKRQFPYFVNGLGGQAAYAFQTPVDGSQARYNARHGAMLVEADDTRLSFRFVTTAGETIDTYALYATPSLEPPVPPSGLVATAVSGGEIDLAWADNSSNERRMHVQQSTDGVAFRSIAELDANATSYSVTGLAENTTYHFRVIARGRDLNSPPSAAASATTGPPGAPAAPTGLAAQGVSPTEIAITWVDASTNERGFLVEHLLGESWAPLASAPRDATQFVLGGLSSSVTYILRLRAYNAYGLSGPSNAAAGHPMTLLRPSVSANEPVFEVGETLRTTVGLTNPGIGGTAADFFLGILAPGGAIAFFTGPGDLALGSVDDFTSFRPIATAVSLSTPFSHDEGSFFSHTWTGGEPRGSYVFFLLAVKADALGDGRLGSDEILGLATASFSFP
jgi:hypothetical protein